MKITFTTEELKSLEEFCDLVGFPIRTIMKKDEPALEIKPALVVNNINDTKKKISMVPKSYIHKYVEEFKRELLKRFPKGFVR